MPSPMPILGISLYSLRVSPTVRPHPAEFYRTRRRPAQARYTLGLIFNAQEKEHEGTRFSEHCGTGRPERPHVRYYLGQVRAKIGQE